MKILIFDTETTGFVTNTIVQLAFKLIDTESGDCLQEYCKYLNNGVPCEPGAFNIHGITEAIRAEQGVSNAEAEEAFEDAVWASDKICAHNLKFDARMIATTFRNGIPRRPGICTMLSSTDLCKLPGKYGNYKWPKLIELHKFLFNRPFIGEHDALADVNATERCLKELISRGIIDVHSN